MAQLLLIEIALASQNLSGAEALEVRNAIEEQIEEAEVGEVVGGGVATDGSSCDLEVESDDPDAAEAMIRELLEHSGLLDGSKIRRA